MYRAWRTCPGGGTCCPGAHLADDNIDKPPGLKTAGEKLVAAAYLLQDMPEPSTPSGRNLRREAQELIEQAVVQQAESSASRMRSKARSSLVGLRTRTARYLCTHHQQGRARQL